MKIRQTSDANSCKQVMWYSSGEQASMKEQEATKMKDRLSLHVFRIVVHYNQVPLVNCSLGELREGKSSKHFAIIYKK